MSVDYKELKSMVKEAMFTGGGINEPSSPQGIPHRMPAADGADKQQDMGDPKANKLYSKAVKAREITEEVVEGCDLPIYDSAYEQAFKASASLRKALNALIECGAHPMPDERVVTPPSNQQRWGGYVPYQGAITYGSDSVQPGSMEEAAKVEMSGLSPKIQQLIGVYTKLPEKEQQAFMAFVMGGATAEK
jgi:hypothetical protein